MKKRTLGFLSVLLILSMLAAGCGQTKNTLSTGNNESAQGSGKERETVLSLTSEVEQITSGLSAVKYEGDYGFDEFLSQGGASSDAQVVGFLTTTFLSNENGLSFSGMPFGCSTLSVKDAEGHALFGRNFDWNTCNARIVSAVPEQGYASLSTVNTDFIHMSGVRLSDLPDTAQAVICLYAPLDGMNEKGLAVSVNMIQDSATISQNTNKPDLTTTTAIRLLLDKAANVDEAIDLLNQYDMHASMDYMMHLAIADTSGRSVVVEYVNNEMIVTETPAVTNFYFAEGEKNGMGTPQSHERYEILMDTLSDKKTMNMEEVRDALDSVSKDNFGEFESTEWSVVLNQSTGEAHYYHRENYRERFTFQIEKR